eukprot:m.209550 g.209550  ORF g.209550 m.209550 type:complete len:359 (-) comp18988_c0_seq1:1088-2164(-)
MSHATRKAAHIMLSKAVMLVFGSCLCLSQCCAGIVQQSFQAKRICRPAPPMANTSLPLCLVIGDSVSIGYSGPLAEILNSTCAVLHAPFSGDGGACDTRYGLQCGDLWLGSTLSGSIAPKYDAIVFNFGLHDTNDERKDEEARDEFVPIGEYGQNVVRFLSKIRRLQPQASVAWLSSTPMHFDMHLNNNVLRYNQEAREQLVSTMLVDQYTDLYGAIVSQCGTPPYYGSKSAPNATHHCSLISDNEEYHYNTQGWAFLATQVEKTFRALLENSQDRQHKLPVDSMRHGSLPATLCPDQRTACLKGTTCIPDVYSNTKWGCCMEPDAISCGDNWHCCPSGNICSFNGTYNHVCSPANSH